LATRFGLWDLHGGKLARAFEKLPGNRTDIATDGRGYLVAMAQGGPSFPAGQNGAILLYEIASGEIRQQIAAHGDHAGAVAFTPDGNRLVSVGSDRTGIVWNISLKSAARGKKPATDADLERAWETLAQRSAPAAYDAIITGATNPEKAVEFLQKRLRPVARLDAAALQRMLADLESETFAVRERARKDLDRLGGSAVPAARAWAVKTESLETKRRLASFLERHDTGTLSPEELRGVRAVEFLEHAATPAARTLLAELATGEPTAELTIRAVGATRRFDGRKK